MSVCSSTESVYCVLCVVVLFVRVGLEQVY